MVRAQGAEGGEMGRQIPPNNQYHHDHCRYINYDISLTLPSD